MGLLSQAFAGAVSGFAGSLSDSVAKDVEVTRSEELQKARELRAESLREAASLRMEGRQEARDLRLEERTIAREQRQRDEAFSTTHTDQDGARLQEKDVKERLANVSAAKQETDTAMNAMNAKGGKGDDAEYEAALVAAEKESKAGGLIQSVKGDGKKDTWDAEQKAGRELSKDYVTPDGKNLTVGEAKKKIENGEPIMTMREYEHKRGVTEKDVDRKERMSDSKELYEFQKSLGGGSDNDGDKPLTADKALERGTMLMKNSRDSNGEIIDKEMYQMGKDYVDWAKSKAKGMDTTPRQNPKGAYDGMLTGGFKEPQGNDSAAYLRVNGGNKGVDRSSPVTKGGVTGYRQADGSVLSADGKRLN